MPPPPSSFKTSLAISLNEDTLGSQHVFAPLHDRYMKSRVGHALRQDEQSYSPKLKSRGRKRTPAFGGYFFGAVIFSRVTHFILGSVNLGGTFRRLSQLWDNAHTLNLKNCLLYLSSIVSQFLDLIH